MKRMSRKVLDLPEEEDYHTKKKRLCMERIRAELKKREEGV